MKRGGMTGFATQVLHADESWTVGFATLVSIEQIDSTIGTDAIRCSVVGCSSIGGCCGAGARFAAGLLMTCVLSASLKIPVSQSGNSPPALLFVTPGIDTCDDAGNCAEAGGGALCGIFPALKVIVAASCRGCCCAGGVTGRPGADPFMSCCIINSTWATLSFQPRLRRKPSRAL